jgi:hypothetical protein
MAFDFKTVFSTAGADKLKAAFAGALEPAMIFASTGSKSAAIWGGMKSVILNNVLGPMALLSGAVLGVIGAVKLLVGNTEMLRKGMQKLKQIEFTEAQFKGLLGGVEVARERVESLYKFANETPFQMGQVAEASRMLEVLTKGALSTTENLKKIGDAAATAGADFSNVSMHVGRMYDGLQSGRPVGESAARLQELGLMSGQARAKIEDMTKAGNSFSEIWKVVSDELEKNEGGMKTMSQTIQGLETTLADAQDKMQAGFAEGFMEAEKESLERARSVAIALQEPLEKLGELFGAVAKVGSWVAGIFLRIAGGAKGLSTAINFAIDAFLMFAAAVMAAQVYTMVAGLLSLKSAFLASSQGAIMASSWNMVHTKGVWASIVALKGQSLANKMAGASAILAGGAYKLASVLVKSFTGAIAASFKVMLANPITAVIAGLAALAVGIWQVVSAYNKEQEAGAKVRKATQEITDKYKEQAAAVTTAAEKLSLLSSMYEGLSSASKDYEAALKDVEAGALSGLLGTDFNEGLQAVQGMEDRMYAIVAQMSKLNQMEKSRLRLSEARLALMQKEVELSKDLAKQGWDQKMAKANQAEQVSLLIQRQNELNEKIAKSSVDREHEVASKEYDDEIGGDKEVRKAEIEIEFGKKIAEQRALSDQMREGKDPANVVEDWMATDAGRQAMSAAAKEDPDRYVRGNLERYGNALLTNMTGGLNVAWSDTESTGMDVFKHDQFLQDTLKNDKRFKGGGYNNEADLIQQKADAMAAMEREYAEEKERKTGLVTIKNGQVDYDTGRTNRQKEMGQIAALESTLQAAARGEDEGGISMTKRDVSILEDAKKQLKEMVKDHEANVKEADNLANAIETIQDNLMAAANLRIIDTNEIEELRKVTKETLNAEKEKAAIMMNANKARIEAHNRSYDKGAGKSRQRAGDDLRDKQDRAGLLQAKIDAGGMSPDDLEDASRELSQLNRDIMTLEGVLKTFDEAEKKTKKWIDANKKLEDSVAKMERQAIKTFNRLKEDLEILAASNEIDFRFDIGDLAGAMDMMEALGNMEDKKFLERRTETLSKKMGDKEAAEMAQKELIEKKRARSEQVQGNAAKARRKQDIAELDLAARMGDPNAKKKATAMKDRDFLEASFRKNLGDSKDPMDISTAKSAALSELMTKKVGEVPEVKTISDSFRKIGAGGGASSTDPQIILARKRTEALKALADLTRDMKAIQLDTKEVIDNRLNFDVK